MKMMVCHRVGQSRRLLAKSTRRRLTVVKRRAKRAARRGANETLRQGGEPTTVGYALTERDVI